MQGQGPEPLSALVTMGAKEQRDVGRPSSNQEAEQTRLPAWSQASVGEELAVSAYQERCELRSMETPDHHIPPTTRASLPNWKPQPASIQLQAAFTIWQNLKPKITECAQEGQWPHR